MIIFYLKADAFREDPFQIVLVMTLASMQRPHGRIIQFFLNFVYLNSRLVTVVQKVPIKVSELPRWMGWTAVGPSRHQRVYSPKLLFPSRYRT